MPSARCCWSRRRSRSQNGGPSPQPAIVAAASLKLLPAVLAPLLWRRIRVRDAAAGAVLLIALYWPHLGERVIPIGSLSRVVNRYRFNGPAYQWLVGIVEPWAVAGLRWPRGWQWRRGFAGDARRARRTWAWPMAVALMLAPLVYPWYWSGSPRFSRRAGRCRCLRGPSRSFPCAWFGRIRQGHSLDCAGMAARHRVRAVAVTAILVRRASFSPTSRHLPLKRALAVDFFVELTRSRLLRSASIRSTTFVSAASSCGSTTSSPAIFLSMTFRSSS